jgi:YgiT-type zinc finger domain-containing protein
MKTEDLIVCDVCGVQEAQLRRVTRSYGKGASLLVIENIPVITCHHCGESYLEPDTIRAIERVKRNKKRLAKPRPVAVGALD